MLTLDLRRKLATPHQRLRPKRRLLTLLPAALLFVLATSGCSQIHIAYNTAGFTIELYANRYLGLDDRQVASWRPLLSEALNQHRDEEVPAITALLTQAAEDVNAGLTTAKVSAWLDQLEPMYQRHARLFAATVAPLLASLSETQINALEKKFQEQAREDAADNSPESLAKRKRKRIKRYIENIEWATGDLTQPQRELVRKEIGEFPDVDTSWYAYRDQQRMALLALLRRGASTEQIDIFLTRWLAEFMDMPVDLAQARDKMRAGLIQTVVALDPTLSEQQRLHFEKQLKTLSEEFQSLERRKPTQAPGV
ncbi:DUF6279 family lipoprotein [Thiorhodovibrio frisius]|uniref:Uncharacterized protein n=1 Tax=Thiorhodovibrio frisius TaxID=631362 RepID=H8Z6T3_9GAMM|nr:DUF6279 family lipoprotein [Thiorhodovibrio frisius]EIC20799.1 hypothetical protein Thi970DRAFT_04461 [Thiorhodovibrio frisius]WPL21850.1 hypothetical protein Thiofri_01986 [Thiorhodovibrio frisius]